MNIFELHLLHPKIDTERIEATSKLMERVRGVCVSCGEKAVFKYLGRQEQPNGDYAFSLYECSNCQSSHSLNQIAPLE